MPWHRTNETEGHAQAIGGHLVPGPSGWSLAKEAELRRLVAEGMPYHEALLKVANTSGTSSSRGSDQPQSSAQ